MMLAFRLVPLVVLSLTVPAPAWSEEHHEHAAAPASPAEAAAPPVARRLWNDLVCLCGECDRLTLAACRCPDAERERANVVGLIRERAPETPADEEAAYAHVLATYVKRFGGRHVLASERRAGAGGWVVWAVFGSMITAVGGAALAFRLMRRSRHAGPGSPRAPHSHSRRRRT